MAKFLTKMQWIATSFCLMLSAPSFAITLKAAMHYTLQTRPDVLISIKQREQANSELLKAEAGFYPSLNANAEAGPESTKSASTNFAWVPLTRSYFQLEMTQNLFNGLNTYFSTKASIARVISSAYEVNSTLQNTAFAVASVYLNIIKERELVKISRENVASYVRTQGLIAKRVRVGLSNRAELEQTEARLAQARSDLLAEIKRYQDAVDDYIEVVGLRPRRITYRGDITLGVDSKASAIKLALIKNPSLRSFEYQISTAVATHRAAYAPMFPSIDVVLEQFRGDNLDGIEGQNYDNFAVVRMSYNLFRGGQDIANQLSTAQKRDEAIEKMNQTRRQVVKNVAQTWNIIENGIQQKVQLKIYTDKTAFVVVAFKRQYVAGKRTLVDVLNAENENFSARRAYIAIYYNLLIAKYQLLGNIGNLVERLNLPFTEAANPKAFGWLTPGHQPFLTCLPKTQ